ncbi:MAG: class I SAM-dependent methyltransferase [Elusimicrobiota bacterium]
MILDAGLYLKRRKENPLTRYRLKRRIEKTIEMIKKYNSKNSNRSILDIGAADGAMLSILKQQFELKSAIGVEPNENLIRAKKDIQVELITASGENLPFNKSQFGIVIISAVIEHVFNPEKVIEETYRVLSDDGILILITVVPWMDKLAEKFQIFPPTIHKHFYRFTLSELKRLLEKNGFNVLHLSKFALPTSGFLLFEETIEKMLNKLHLDFFMTYELAVGAKI